MTTQPSPFDWQGKPSIFSKDHDHNGVNTGRSQRASSLEKNDIFLVGSNVYLRVPERQLSAHSRAVIAKTKEVLGV